jgi:hypothetical protein
VNICTTAGIQNPEVWKGLFNLNTWIKHFTSVPWHTSHTAVIYQFCFLKDKKCMQIFFGKSEEKRLLENICVDGRIIQGVSE